MYWFAFLNRLSREWIVVSKDEAQQNRYFGLRGWLLLFYLATVWSVIQNLIMAFASPDSEFVEILGGGNPDLFGGNAMAVARIRTTWWVATKAASGTRAARSSRDESGSSPVTRSTSSSLLVPGNRRRR
jgi:hypothetical protein